MMKHGFVIVLFVVLLGLVALTAGCSFFDQPGQTADEGHRSHLRTLRVNRQEMMQDIDRTLLLEEPSKLTPNRFP